MNNDQLASLISSVLKSAEKLQSFVIEEIALTELLQGAWKPIGKKIRKQVSGVIDFKKKRYHREKGIQISTWLTDDMFDDTSRKAWSKIAKKAEKYIARAYQRGIDEEGQFPPPARKSDVRKSVSSVYAERKEQAVTLLLGMVEKSFTEYASTVAIPAFHETVAQIGQVQALMQEFEKQHPVPLDADARQIMEFETARKLRAQALRQAEIQQIDMLTRKINDPNASMAANLATARAHHFGFLDWAKENGIEYYRVVARMDARTCAACTTLDGKVFHIDDALAFRDKFFEAQGDKAKLKELTPFLTPAAAQNITGVSIDVLSTETTPFDFDKYIDFNEIGNARDFRKKMDQEFHGWTKTLTATQKNDLDFYKLTGYRQINGYLRDTTREVSSETSLIQNKIDNILKTYTHSLQDNIITYRGADADKFTAAIGSEDWETAVGKKYKIDQAFMSTSPMKKTPVDFTFNEDNPVIYRIYIDKGSKSVIYPDQSALMLSNNQECELLLKPGREFKVLRIDEEVWDIDKAWRLLESGPVKFRVVSLHLLD